MAAIILLSLVEIQYLFVILNAISEMLTLTIGTPVARAPFLILMAPGVLVEVEV
jgi:hypothetical protein